MIQMKKIIHLKKNNEVFKEDNIDLNISNDIKEKEKEE